MKSVLILFANGYPYNTSEPFLESEYPLYPDYFDKVLIVTACRRGETATRRMDGNTEVIEDYTLSRDLRSVIGAIAYVLGDRMFYRELSHLFFSEGFTPRKLYDLFVFSLCANHRAMQAIRWLRRNPGYRPAALYAYWLHIPAYAALRLRALLRQEVYTVSRAHGYDLYLERHASGYIPFHRQMVGLLDAVAPVSQQGRRYLAARYGASDRVSVHHLGAADRMRHNPYSGREVLRVVSCARAVALKRLSRIADALSRIADMPVEWLHIGGGPTLKDLARDAGEKLPSNVSAVFAGDVPNAQVYEIYGRQPFHVFVNVSETEGIPVAVMEAMSFDIPVIATDVGGTAELVDEGINGYLLRRDFADGELVSLLRRMAAMPEEDYRRMRRAARSKFEREYCAETNCRRFLGSLAARRTAAGEGAEGSSGADCPERDGGG